MDLAKRWGELSDALSSFLQREDLAPGDIWRTKTYGAYAPGAPQQFRNFPLAEPIPLKNGTAVG
jgi:hypothetical protein